MKKTHYCEVDKSKPQGSCLARAASILRWGGIVAFPTETVYGLGGNALNPKAVEKIFIAKGRPPDNPLIVHIAHQEELNSLASHVPPAAYQLIKVFWPGPLTLVLPRSPEVSDIVTAGLDTVGIRMPAHPVALALLKKAGVPVAAPSANLSGKPSPTRGIDVLRDLVGKVDVIVDGGIPQIGIESTVLDLTVTPPMILRPGGVTREALEIVLGEVGIDPALENPTSKTNKAKSPGMKYTHYAPKAQVIVITGLFTERGLATLSRLVRLGRQRNKKVGLLLTAETADLYQTGFAKPSYIEVLGSRNQPKEIASHLFKALRNCDHYNLDIVYAEGIPPKGLGLAIMNRLIKAAGNRIIKV